jgi:hypothetical protein
MVDMTTHLETKFEIKSWDEEPFRELPEGQKLARASVALTAAMPELTPELTEASLNMLLHYRADGTSTYLSLMHVEGRLGERTGGFTLHGTGAYDGSQARGEFTIVPGSGTGELAGITGSGASVSTHGDYPFMPFTLDYALG